MSRRFFIILIDLATLLTIGLAGVLLVSSGEGAAREWRFLVAILAMLAMRATVWATFRKRPYEAMYPGERGLFMASMLCGSLIMIGALGNQFLQAYSVVDEPLSDRVVGVLSGVFLLALGNFTPKFHVPKADENCSQYESTAVHRRIGIAFFTAGIAVIGTWLIAPVGIAPEITMAITMIAILFGIIPVIRLVSRSLRSS